MQSYNSVLIVDDDPVQIAVLTAYFSGLKVKSIQGAEDSTVALDILAENSADFDLLVSDIQMPNIDGIEFMRHLKEFGYSGKLAIISGVGDKLMDHAARLAKLHKLQLIGQINKPLNKKALDAVFLSQRPETASVPKAAKIRYTNADFAYALNNGEFHPYYQPKIDVQNGQIIGAEALVRWIKPDYGIIVPDLFIPFAEKNGFMEELTFLVFEQVLSDLPLFLSKRPDLKFAFNLPPTMIDKVALPAQLMTRMNAASITSKSISFEITENSILNLEPATLEVLSRLRIYDFDIAVDDFGTGSSNINILKDFPYSELKLDKSYISNIASDNFSKEVVIAAIKLARQQEMSIVAEGVEDHQTWDIIREMGIEYAQGYYFAKPMDAAHLCEYITNQQKDRVVNAA
jgi:EAL domain-containing protein (putative c-di-GMP-specific phosphodiesterase class I)/FixJ family two-component response regulator